ncbi:ATP-binding protein [Inquilinus ginsengisoli]|uniref:ATP-binding protein n=1 Tax=Inquilinus ginsengisoli TaxID=363840 RepID=UPI003D250BF9
MMHPDDWEPNLSGAVAKDLPQLLESWIGHDRPITILDLSGIPSVVMSRLIGGILNIIYEGLFWGRELPEGGRQRPQLVVMEEAHRYLGKDTESPAREMVQRIVKEGRKFGVGAMIVSQRPSEIDETILSQCGTFFSLRLSNGNDRAKVQAALPDNLSGVVDSLPVLRTGEAIIIGEAARLPIRCRVTLPREGERPESGDPLVAASWSKEPAKGDYIALVAAWRSQNSKLKYKIEEEK